MRYPAAARVSGLVPLPLVVAARFEESQFVERTMMTNQDSRTRVPTEDVQYDEDALRDAEDKMHAEGTGGGDEARDKIEGPTNDVKHDEKAKREAEERMKTA